MTKRTTKIEHINGIGNVPCLLINDRYQIYLDDGVVYDTKYAKDIPQYVFKIRDIAMLSRDGKLDNNVILYI